MGAPSGNSNAKKGKAWYDALRKACVQKNALEKIAEKVVDLALEGERWAVEEIGNRFDGKPAQSLELSGDPDAPLQVIERRIVRPGD